MNTTNKLIYDASIGQWRLKTEADIRWVKAVVEAAS